jgi:hydroxymethylpyrimidine/phosphomethylpyrimidine kinase
MGQRLRGRVLSIAGSDSGGGAGIQADIKTITALGGYAATAVTAITVQNTVGVSAVHAVPPEIVAGQIEAVLSDIGADAIKTGMLVDAATIDAVRRTLDRHRGIPLVVDPVMIAKGGAKLLDDRAIDALVALMKGRALLVTPNLAEAGVLIGREVRTESDMRAALGGLLALDAGAVLLKGGHLEGGEIVDMFGDRHVTKEWRDAKIESRHTHGTGCTLASAVATGIAQGLPMIEAIERARPYVRRAIETAPGFGRGHGPLNHGHPFKISQTN